MKIKKKKKKTDTNVR